jgi:soluble lytic murein transglycosylase
MKRIISIVCILVAIFGALAYFANEFWIHRYDELITRQAKIYRQDEVLIWSVVFEETWFRSWLKGEAGEVGLMQITPLVAREWAKETGMKEIEKEISEDFVAQLQEPERNIQIGCWYLEKIGEKYRDKKSEDAMTLAAYNAGPSRVEEWTKDAGDISEDDFISRITISSTKSYVTSILKRQRSRK